MLAILALLVPSASRAADRLSVLLDWFVNPNHAPLIIAGSIGAYQRAGLDVTFIQPADPTMPVRLVAAGQADIALGYQTQMYQQVERGLPVIRVGTLIDRPMNCLASLASSHIQTVADLKGRRVGYNEVGGAANLAEIDQMLSSAKLTRRDITLIDVGAGLTASLLTHRVDAVGVDRNFEPFEIADKGASATCLDFEKFGVPLYDQLILVTQRDRAHDPVIARFLRAVREGEAYLQAHPQESWRLFVKAYPATDNTLNRRAWDFTVSYFAHDPLMLDAARWREYGDFLVAHAVIAKNPPVATLAVDLGSTASIHP